ncbi:ParA family protein [Ferroplasma acidiphilum]|uniref:ParA family protein n=1 Tax=Ferroplasma acidiphilum TaxID=74969 RepID=UPI0023F4BD31|nr:AAA family ATPase [Ferroplasma acidiphilum]
MVHVISTINLKGGVGKTQTTIALSELLANNYNKKVLIIDLDPQTNATVSLMDENNWLEMDKRGNTIFQLFSDKVFNTELFNINNSIVKNVSNVNSGIKNLDLLPSSLRLIDIQDKLPLVSNSGYFIKTPITILKESLGKIINNYDYVLIDCPPNLGLITLSGIYISDYYLIPTVPDILSTYGIPQILSRIENFKMDANINIKPLGIIISMFRSNNRLHNSIIDSLKYRERKGDYPRIFNTYIPLSVKISEAAEFNSKVNTLGQKYGYDLYNKYNELTREIMSYVE